jgi:hypothetical protein
MRYFKVQFRSTYGEPRSRYALSKTKGERIVLDTGGYVLIDEYSMPYVFERFEVHSCEYVGIKAEITPIYTAEL